MNIPSSEKKHFQQLVLERYSANKRDLPWRKTTDPYKIMVSEVMLQQTQVPRVIQKFNRWMELRPTVTDLANAPRTDVLREWSGLGFNRRAINLHEAAKQLAAEIATRHPEQREGSCKKPSNSWDSSLRSEWRKLWTMNYSPFPKKSIDFLMSDYAYLRSLPWIWEYTANAVLAFAYNQEVPVMDINIKRVLIHTFQLPHDTPLFELQELALSLVPQWKSRDWHNALMDYGSQVLHSRATGIQSAKQSTFKWSDREVRWWIMKQLAIKPSITIKAIQTQWLLKDVPSIVDWLIRDKMVVFTTWWKNKTISVNSWL